MVLAELRWVLYSKEAQAWSGWLQHKCRVKLVLREEENCKGVRAPSAQPCVGCSMGYI